jgi:hypothetical protein
LPLFVLRQISLRLFFKGAERINKKFCLIQVLLDLIGSWMRQCTERDKSLGSESGEEKGNGCRGQRVL